MLVEDVSFGGVHAFNTFETGNHGTPSLCSVRRALVFRNDYRSSVPM